LYWTQVSLAIGEIDRSFKILASDTIIKSQIERRITATAGWGMVNSWFSAHAVMLHWP
jgi:hypothetical protein